MKNRELVDAILLSYQFVFLWFKIITSLKVTKTYGGFLRTIEIIFKKTFLLLVFILAFVILMTGVFNLLFQQTLQFQLYFDTFFYLLQASQQEYELSERWNIFINFTTVIYMGVCTLVLINLVISYETSIYDSTENDILPEHRCNLVKLYEYIRWDNNYGIFKFLFAPLNVIQVPFSIAILFVEDKVKWTQRFTKILYFPICLLYFIVFIIYQTYQLLLSIYYLYFVYSFKYSNRATLSRIALRIVLGPAVLLFYYFRDLVDFWRYSYRDQTVRTDESAKEKYNISEFRKSFETMINIIIKRIDKNKKNKVLSINELIENWRNVTLQHKSRDKKEEKNNKYQCFIMGKKKNSKSDNMEQYSPTNKRFSQQKAGHITFKTQEEKNVEFLKRFADKDGFIDREMAKNLLIKKNYYYEDYFECMYYFRYKYFKEIMTYFVKNTNEIRRDTNKLRGVYIDFLKINEKFKTLKLNLKAHKFEEEQVNAMSYGISCINTFFARKEAHLNDEHVKEIYNKLKQEKTYNNNKQKNDNSEKSFNHQNTK